MILWVDSTTLPSIHACFQHNFRVASRGRSASQRPFNGRNNRTVSSNHVPMKRHDYIYPGHSDAAGLGWVSRREPAKSQRSDCGSELPRESWTEIYHRSSVTFVAFYWAIVKKMHCLIIRSIIMLMVISYNRRGFKSTYALRIRIQNSSKENWRPQKIPGESFPHHVQIMLCWLRGDGHEKDVNEREKLLESRAKEENRGGKRNGEGRNKPSFPWQGYDDAPSTYF